MSAGPVLLQSLGNGVIFFVASAGSPAVPVLNHSVYVIERSTPAGQETNPAYQVTVYATSALSVPLTQPLSTGSNGAGPGGIPGWVAGEQSIDLYDATTGQRTSAEPVAAGDVAVLAEAPLNVQSYGAKIDGSTNDGPAINAAINAAFGAGIAQKATKGNRVLIPPGVCVASGIVLKDGVQLVGVNAGGAVFSDTDSGQPPNGSFLKLAAGASGDLISTDNFAALNATPSSATAYNTPGRCGLRGLTIDGNYWNAPSGGRCLAAFARALTIRDVIFQNAKGDGVYINGPTDSGETELMMDTFRIVNCQGNGLNLQGAHDLSIGRGFVNNNAAVGIIESANLGTALFEGIHAYSNGGYNWQLGCAYASHVNCISDGTPGVQILANAVNWNRGSIYGIVSPRDELICLGDGTTRTVQGCHFDTAIFQLGLGGRMFRYRSNTTVGWNRFLSTSANLNGNTHLFAGDGYATASGPVLSTATTITVTQSSTPVQNGAVIISDGSHAVSATVSSGGGTGTLTLSGAIGTALGSGTNNISVWNTASTPADSFRLGDAPSGSTGFYQEYGHPNGTSTLQWTGLLAVLGPLQISNHLGNLGPRIFGGAGTPQGAVSGNSGDYFFRSDGGALGAGTSIYRSTGGTNWTGIA